jgi:hypothetical protein
MLHRENLVEAHHSAIFCVTGEVCANCKFVYEIISLSGDMIHLQELESDYIQHA